MCMGKALDSDLEVAMLLAMSKSSLLTKVSILTSLYKNWTFSCYGYFDEPPGLKRDWMALCDRSTGKIRKMIADESNKKLKAAVRKCLKHGYTEAQILQAFINYPNASGVSDEHAKFLGLSQGNHKPAI